MSPSGALHWRQLRHERCPEYQVTRLQRLTLIEAIGSGYQLTLLGWERYKALPRPMGWAVDSIASGYDRADAVGIIQSLKERKQKSRQRQQA